MPAGNYSFSLVASGLGVNAYAWIDGHLVGRYAQSGVNLIGHDPTTFVRDESMDDVLPIGPFPAGALSGGLDNNTGLYRKAVLVRVWYNPLNDSSTGGVLCKTGGCTEQTPNTAGGGGVSLALHWSDGGKKAAVDARKASQGGDGLLGRYIQMPLADVGMTSLLVSEAEALVELAEILGRTETAAMLRARCADMRARIQAHMWSEELGMYSNTWPNGSFYPRIGPTSFFPLFAQAPTDDQAKQMMTGWLMNASHFCVSLTGDGAGNADTCYWGLPSIAASDPAYPPLGYWRGVGTAEHPHVLVACRAALCSRSRGDTGSQGDGGAAGADAAARVERSPSHLRELLATQSAGRVHCHWVPLLPLVRPPSVLPSCVLLPCAWLLLPSP